MVLKLKHAPESADTLLKVDMLGPHPTYIQSKFPEGQKNYIYKISL